jgi:hypothetical protein
VNGGSGGGNPRSFAPSPRGRILHARARASSERARLKENGGIERFSGARPAAAFCIPRARLRREARLPN